MKNLPGASVMTISRLLAMGFAAQVVQRRQERWSEWLLCLTSEISVASVTSGFFVSCWPGIEGERPSCKCRPRRPEPATRHEN